MERTFGTAADSLYCACGHTKTATLDLTFFVVDGVVRCLAVPPRSEKVTGRVGALMTAGISLSTPSAGEAVGEIK